MKIQGRAFAFVVIALFGAAAFGLTSEAPSRAADTPSPSASGEDPVITKLAAAMLSQAQAGSIDRTRLTSQMDAALTPDAVASVSQQLRPLGKPKSMTFVSRLPSGPYETYRYRIVWDSVAVDETFAIDGDGKIAGWLFRPAAPPQANDQPAASAAPTTTTH
jgi:hypothetical protein